MDKAGFALCLIGLGGLAESYGLNKSMAFSLAIIIVGGILIAIGDMSSDFKNNKRDSNDNANVLDRLYFLRR